MYDLRKIQAIKNIKNLDDFGRSKKAALQAAGFSDSVANHPKKVTDSKWFKAALPSYDELISVMKDEVLAAHLDHYIFPLSMKDEEIIALIEAVPGCKVKKIKHGETQTWAYYWVPDHKSRQTVIDMIFKLKGDYAPIKTQVIDPYEGWTGVEYEEAIAKAKRERDERGLNNG